MSRYRELTGHLKGLGDIRAILAGMRTLAAVELQRVTRLQDAGEQLRRGLEAAAAAHFAGRSPPPAAPDGGVRVLLGSEKGLCGDFNERLLAAAAGDAIPLVLVGAKLAGAAVPAVAARCPGALAADDVGPVLAALAQTLAGLGAAGGRLEVICHDPRQHRVRRVAVLPPPAGAASGVAPRLQLPAPQVEAALLEQYLLAVFNGLLLDSLLVENQQRIAHLQAALQRLDERCEALRQQQRRARQEQIIEEVEVALGVAGMAPAHSPGPGAEA